jgi:hypothetical protein
MNWRMQKERRATLHNEVCKLMALAYPGTTQIELNDILARGAFITALHDRELETKVWARDPTDLNSAFKVAVRVEAYLQSTSEDRGVAREHRARRYKYDDPTRMRQVQQKATETDKSQSLVHDLQKPLASYEKRQEDISKELDKLRLLAECKKTSQVEQEASTRKSARDSARQAIRDELT